MTASWRVALCHHVLRLLVVSDFSELFGLSGARDAFERMLDKILFYVQGVHISVNDKIIYSKTMAELAQRGRKGCNPCRKHILELNRSK